MHHIREKYMTLTKKFAYAKKNPCLHRTISLTTTSYFSTKEYVITYPYITKKIKHRKR